MIQINSFIKMFTMKIYNFASYKHYYDKRINNVKNKKDKYLKMHDDEFLMTYIEINSLYERKKMIFNVVFVGLIISTVMDAWKYCFEFLQKILISDNEVVMAVSNKAKMVVIILVSIIIGVLFLIIFVMIRRLYKINQEKILIEEVKKIRSGE